MKYRPEIDGLRALAVIPVILFHAGFELFSGGFIGVDVFFVISGYLITTTIIEDIENNRFRIGDFYERRARRILPALTTMVIASIIMGWFVLTPYFYRDLFQTTFSISIFASNVLLYIKSGYFSEVSELKPFLHTWSLAVEEQYYVLFPIFLVIGWRCGKSRVLWMIVVVGTISLMLSEWSWRNQPSANFYLAHTRAWELLAGSFVAFTVYRKGVQSNNMLAILGLFAIIYSTFYYNERTPFPSIYALFPVLGVVLLILYADKKTLVAKFLSTKPLVGIGLISYSAYLWHQPVFSFMRHSVLFEVTSFHYMFAISIVTVLSVLSWRFVERPFRKRNLVSNRTILISSILVILAMGIIGILGHKKLGFPERFSAETQAISKGAFDKNPRQNKCFYLNRLKTINNSCILGSEKVNSPSVALIGNSHGDQLAHSLSESLRQKGLAAYNLSFLGCNPVNFIGETSDFVENECFELISKFLSDHKKVNTLIISFRWMLIMNGNGFGAEVHTDEKPLEDSISLRRGEIIARKLEKLVGPERNLILIYPVPEAGVDVPNFTVKKRMLHDEQFTLRIPYPTFEERSKYANISLNSVLTKKITRIYPSKAFCKASTNGFCETVINQHSLYYDNHHLSNFGASLIIPSIITAISD